MARAHALHNASSASTWLDCGLHIHYKKAAEANGEVIDTSSSASIRGNLLHDVCEAVLPKFIAAQSTTEGQLILSTEIENARNELQNKHERYEDVVWGDDEIEHTEMALNMVMDLILRYECSSVGVEVGVELSHEPGEVGKVDVLALGPDTILVIDYKFGQGEVEASTPQLKIYAANAIDKLWPKLPDVKPSRILRVIVQPALYREPIIDPSDQTLNSMKRFQAYVDLTAENQRSGRDIRGASDLSTCKWCPFKDRCTHRPSLVAGMLQQVEDVTEGHPLRHELIERIVRQASMIADVIKEAKQEIIDNEEEYPDWIRARVSNGKSWSDLVDEQDIIDDLHAAGVEDWYSLKTPSQIRDQAKGDAKILQLLDGLTIDRGYHVRLRPSKGVKGTDVVEPPKRPGAKSKPPTTTAKKAPAKKAAAKKKAPAKKKAAAKKAPAKKRGAKKTTNK